MKPEGVPGPGSKRFCSKLHEAMDDVLASIFRKIAKFPKCQFDGG